MTTYGVCKEELGIVVNCKLNMHKAIETTTAILDSHNRSIVSEIQEVIITLYFTPVKCHFKYCIQFQATHFAKDLQTLE